MSIIIMAGELNLHQKIARGGGAVFIAVGLVCNEWILARYFSPDGYLILPNRIAIGIFDIVCMALGIRLCQRMDLRVVIKVGTSVIATVLLMLILEKALTFRGTALTRENPHGSGSYRLVPHVNTLNIRINSYGMRWKEVNQSKPSGLKRVAFLGDSFTFGCCADHVEQSFVGIFDARLHLEGIEVLNFGVGGYGLPDMHLLLKEEVLAFHPDILFLMFFNGNDFSDTFLSMEGNRVLGEERKEQAQQKIPAPFRDSTYDRSFSAIRKTELYSLVLDARENLRKRNGKEIHRSPRDFFLSTNFVASSFWCRTDYPPVAAHARDLSLEFLDRIFRLCRANKIEMVMGTLPFSGQVYARQITGPGYDIRYPQKYVEEFTNKNSIPYIDTLPAFRNYAQKFGKELFALDGHYNNEGHRVAGEALVTFFRNHVQLDKKQIASNKQ